MLCIAKEAPDASHLPNEPIPTAPLVGAVDPVRPPPSIFCRTSGRVCRGRCRAQLFATKERYRCGLPLAGTHRPASAILHRAIVFECRGGRLCPPAKGPLCVRRSLLHSVSAGVAKTPHPHPPSSFPNCDRFTGSQFGSWKFYNAARYLDDGGQAAFCGYGKKQDFHTPQIQSKALVDEESREPSERFSGRLFLFFAVRHGSFLSPNRERKEWGRKIRFLF